MPQKINLTILLLFFQIAATAQLGEIAPINPEFVRQNGKGFAPPVLPFFGTSGQLRAATSLPSRYDMRDTPDLLTPPRNQGAGTSTCWAFATMDAVQSVWARQGHATPLYSPENLAACHGFDVPKTIGGTADMATAYLARHGGPVYETADPYVPNNSSSCNPSITRTDKDAIVAEALYLPKNVSLIKEMVYTHGGVLTGMCNKGFYAPYFNPATNATFIKEKGTFTTNHAGTIVGWDDDFAVSVPDGSPAQNGAWIIKNTTGTGTQDGGYYYASYEDAFVGENAVVYPKRIEKSAVDSIYFYDKLGQTGMYGYNGADSACIKVRYRAPRKQKITHIGTYTTAANSILDVEIYNWANNNVLFSKKNTMFNLPGYHSIEIDENVVVKNDFYVVIKYKTPNYDRPVPINISIENYATVDAMQVGYQAAKRGLNNQWTNFGKGVSGGEFNACIKVYAQAADNPAVPYDNIEDALELPLNTTAGAFSNVGATWQPNEPVPPETGCTTQTGWCEGEGLLHNSLWFKFQAPASGTVNITTSGFDNQIAVYDALATGTYADLLSGNSSDYALLAANDDASATEAAAAITNLNGLTPNRTYWLQMDGSFGGAEGAATIRIDALTSGIAGVEKADIRITNPLKNKVLRIENASKISAFSLADLNGKTLLQSKHNGDDVLQKDLSALPSGIYVLRVEISGNRFSEKIILE